MNFPFAWPHQWAQLEGAPNWDQVDLSSMRFVDFKTPVARHPTVSTKWFEPGHAYGNTETFTITTCFPANTPPEVHGGQQRRGAAGRDAQDRRPADRRASFRAASAARSASRARR